MLRVPRQDAPNLLSFPLQIESENLPEKGENSRPSCQGSLQRQLNRLKRNEQKLLGREFSTSFYLYKRVQMLLRVGTFQRCTRIGKGFYWTKIRRKSIKWREGLVNRCSFAQIWVNEWWQNVFCFHTANGREVCAPGLWCCQPALSLYLLGVYVCSCAGITIPYFCAGICRCWCSVCAASARSVLV